MEKKMLKIILTVIFLIILTGCSKTTPTGEMVYEIVNKV